MNGKAEQRDYDFLSYWGELVRGRFLRGGLIIKPKEMKTLFHQIEISEICPSNQANHALL